MSKKTEVLRLTKTESNIITAIRNTGLDSLLTDLDVALLMDKSSSSQSLRALRVAIKDEVLLKLEQLVELGNLSASDADIISQAIKNNKSIIITGDSQTGKTTLLNALIMHYPEHLGHLALLDTSRDCKISTAFAQTKITDLTQGSLSIRELTNTLAQLNLSHLVISELKEADDILTYITALSFGIPVILTLNSTTHAREGLISGAKQFKKVAAEVMREADFLAVRCSVQDGKHCIEVDL